MLNITYLAYLFLRKYISFLNKPWATIAETATFSLFAI